MALRPETPASRADQLAASEAAKQDVFLREVDDALRQDTYLTAAKQYGKPIGAAVVLGLAALGGYLFWDSRQSAAAEAQSEKLIVALDQVEGGALSTGDEQLTAIAKDGKGAGKFAAQMLRGGIALERGNRDEGAKIFAGIASDAQAPQPYRDLASIREVAIKFDTMPPQQVIDRLKPLAIPGNPWFGSAGEMVGAAYLKLNKPELAGPLFASLAKDKTVPESIRRRSQQLAGVLGVDSIDNVAETLAEQAAPAPAQ